MAGTWFGSAAVAFAKPKSETDVELAEKHLHLICEIVDNYLYAIKAAREPCFKAGLMAKAATLPDGADPDDLVRTRGVDAMRAVIKASKGLLEFMIESILDVSYVRGDASERQARAREINALLNSEDDPTVRAMARRYADEVARRLGLVNDKLVDSQMGMIDRTTFDALSRSVEQALAPKPESRERAHTTLKLQVFLLARA